MVGIIDAAGRAGFAGATGGIYEHAELRCGLPASQLRDKLALPLCACEPGQLVVERPAVV